MSALWTISANPRRRRKTHSRRHRTAAQRAATARMLAANRARRNPSRRRRHHAKLHAPRAIVIRTNPTKKRTHRTRRHAAHTARRAFGAIGVGAGALLKTGFTAAGGAILVDAAMGFVNGVLPASMNTKQNADGTVNYMNYAAKFGVALGVRALASKMTSMENANKIAAGSITVMAYELLRPLVQGVLPASMSLGWYNPAVTYRPGATPGIAPGMGRYIGTNAAGMGRYMGTNVTPMRMPLSPMARRG